jgi:glycosyltransferase involved in cell wall biosynthesis
VNDFWFLASPYSRDSLGLENAFYVACKARALLVKAGILCFSPIVHSHCVAIHGDIDPHSHEIWLTAEAPFRYHAKGAIMLMSPGYEESFGMKFELAEFQAEGKPVVWMNPGVLPEEFRNETAHE